MSRPSSVPSAATEPVQPRTGATLLALTESESLSFFREGLGAGHDPAHVHTIDPIKQREAWVDCLTRLGPDVVVSGWCTPPIPPACTVLHGGSVRYICHVSGSVRHVVSRDLIGQGLWVTNWGRLVAPVVAEHALLLVLGALRNQRAWPEVLIHPRRRPKAELRTRTLFEKRVGLHGFGAIAQALVPLLQPFRVQLRAFSTGLSAAAIQELGVEPAASLRDLCAESDVLICCEALTPATRGELGRAALQALPREAVFVNVGRGAVVDEAALLEVIAERDIRVASDVFAQEPLDPDSPFLQLPDAILSPHIGGPTHDFYGRCGALAQANLAAYRRGETPTGLITTAIYDRST